MAPKLYVTILSPPCRGALLAAKAANIKIDIEHLDMEAGEHLKPEFVKLNPQHTLPTLQDDDFTTWDSHAIAIYLIEKYAENDSLYPKDIKKRAIINQRLHFDSSVLFPSIYALFKSRGVEGVNVEALMSKVIQAYEFLETFLGDNDFMTGDDLTIADLSIVATLSTADLIVKVEANKFPNLYKWLRKIESLSCYDINRQGLNKLKEMIAKLQGSQ